MRSKNIYNTQMDATDFGIDINISEGVDTSNLFLELRQQEEEWKQTISEIMLELGIEHYPTRKEFGAVGQKTLYDTIRNYMGHELLAEQMELVDGEEQKLRDIVFDLMLKFEINYYPSEGHFKQGKKGKQFGKIKNLYGHDEFRKKMKLLTKHQYEELNKKKG